MLISKILPNIYEQYLAHIYQQYNKFKFIRDITNTYFYDDTTLNNV